MKTFKRKSIIKSLNYVLDATLIIQGIVVVFGIITLIGLIFKNQSSITDYGDSKFATMSSGIGNVMIAIQNPDLSQHMDYISQRFQLFILIYGFMMLFAIILITLQIRSIFISFRLDKYFDPLIPLRIKKIALIIFAWVIVDYALRYIPQIIIPDYFISSSMGLNSFNHGSSYGIFGFDLKMLIVSIIIYILSIVYKIGNNLKEETSLTI